MEIRVWPIMERAGRGELNLRKIVILIPSFFLILLRKL
jgi:hypothetical protein